MAITHKAGNATLEVNGKIDSAGAGAVNIGNHGNAATISLGSNAAGIDAANLTVNKAVDFGIENFNGNAATINLDDDASTIRFNNANSLTGITVPTGISKLLVAIFHWKMEFT